MPFSISAINSIVPAPSYLIDLAAFTDKSPKKVLISLFNSGQGASSIIFCWRLCNEQSLSNR